ncbi:MAG: SMC family ATPase [Thermoanaerobacteraceae bacterium]|nr:SMC family ATPase [Thermoanaerobacteraceae bacterium]
MIPLNLKLKNFMSYSDNESLDFTKFHIAAIVGENGNGKSSLWDAITWCIWGRARGLDAAGRGADDLIRIGADAMEVEFTFRIENTKYRILRKKKRNSSSILEFNIITNDETFKSLTQEKIIDTEKKIKNTIMLDYDTFIASSFMPQNKDGFFSEVEPTKRKEIFSEILGLDFYNKLQIKAKEKRIEYEQKLVIIDEQLKMYSRDIEDKKDIIKKKEENEELSFKKQLILNKLNKRLEGLLEKKKEMDEVILKIKEFYDRIERDKKIISEYKEMLLDIENKRKELKDILNNEDNIIKGFNNFMEIQNKLKNLDGKYIYFNELEKSKTEIQNKINSIKKEKEMELKNLTSRYNEYLEELDKLNNHEIELKELIKKMPDFDNLENQFKQIDEKIIVLNTKLVENTTIISTYNKKIKELNENYNKILNTGAICPTCHTALNAEKKELLLNGFKEEEKDYKIQIFTKKKENEKLVREINMLKNNKDNINNLLLQKNEFLVRINTLKNKLSEREFKINKIKELRERIEKLNDIINTENYAINEKEELSLIQTEITKLNFSFENYKLVKLKYDKYKKYEKLMEQLNISKQTIVTYDKTCETYIKNIKIYEENLEKDKKTMEFLKKQNKDYDMLIEDINKLKIKIENENKDFLNININLSTLTEKINNINTIESKINILKKDREKNAMERHYYEILEYSFGKKGIQALIIENAIPELEDIANNILSKLSDGKMYLNLITQKINKNGSVLETLNIEISDDVGTRKYELFSGGEAFRINFALRIALSKFLSKRAGVKLQTLIIDEGFGSQDKIGRQNIIDVLNLIKDEFELIVVISHLEDFKDNFPYTINITKDENGSHINCL